MKCTCGAVDCGPFVYSPERLGDGVIHSIQGCLEGTDDET